MESSGRASSSGRGLTREQVARLVRDEAVALRAQFDAFLAKLDALSELGGFGGFADYVSSAGADAAPRDGAAAEQPSDTGRESA